MSNWGFYVYGSQLLEQILRIVYNMPYMLTLSTYFPFYDENAI